jgi:hypothetical protein
MAWKKLPPRVNLGSPIWSVGDWLSVCCSFSFGKLLAFPWLSSPAFFLFSPSAYKPSIELPGILQHSTNLGFFLARVFHYDPQA